jgi:hypothetical protein
LCPLQDLAPCFLLFLQNAGLSMKLDGSSTVC